MSLRKLLTEISKDLYEYTQEELMEVLEENGIALEDRQLEYYVGSGGYGDVYKVKGKNKVIKFTSNKDEYRKINWIMDAQNNTDYDHIVKYYFNKQVNDYLYFSAMEYLERHDIMFSKPTREMMKKLEQSVYTIVKGAEEESKRVILLKIRDFLSHMKGSRDVTPDKFQSLKVELKDIVANYQLKDVQIILHWIWGVISLLSNRDVIEMVEDISQHDEFFKDVIRGSEELQEMDVWHGDIHLNNILKDPKTNKYKLIDPL